MHAFHNRALYLKKGGGGGGGGGNRQEKNSANEVGAKNNNFQTH